jgi:lysophospholipase L1-like esterase
LKRRNTKNLIVFAVCFLLGIFMLNGFIQPNYQTIIAANNYSVDYTQNDWDSGATVNVTITNNGSTAINGWTLAWTFSGNQKITNMWNASYTQSGTAVTATNLSYNSTIAANGGTVNFGFTLTYSGTNAKPTSFILNDSASTTPTPTSTSTSTPTPTPTVSSDVLSIGRFDTSDSTGPKFAWSATTIKANFQGTSISVNLKSTGDNWFNVIIDSVVMTPVNITSSTSMPMVLASGLTSGTHTIELVRRTEAWVGEVQFLGFTVGDGSLLDPPSASSRRIEFIGDSITCGYGNEGTSQYQSFTTKNENAYLAYGSVTARTLDADQITVAWSGKGMIRNYGGSTTEVLPDIYLRILPYNTTLVWDPSQWIPQVVVINLGTNDFSTGVPDETTFTTAYANFVKKIRSQYSDAHIYCAVGPMLSGDNLTYARNYISTVVSQLQSAGDTKVHFIEFPVQDGTLGYGEDWHPSVATHAKMASQLAAQIKTDLGW